MCAVLWYPASVAREVGLIAGSAARRRRWLGEEEPYFGKVFQISDSSLGGAAPEERVPIYIAALGPKMLRLAGEMADGVLLSWTASSYLKQAIQLVRDGAISSGTVSYAHLTLPTICSV